MRGVLKGWDPLLNLVLDEAIEDLRGTLLVFAEVEPLVFFPSQTNIHHRSSCIGFCIDPTDPYRLSGKERKLGIMVARGTSVMTIAPIDGVTEIENPFQGAQ